MSTVAHVDGHRGKKSGDCAARKAADCATGKMWFETLRKSLRMSYATEHGGRPRQFDRVKARVEFHPAVVRAMDLAIGKRWGDKIYKLAFEASKSRADAMLKEFDDLQIATNRPFFKHALARFATFAPSESVDQLAKPLSECLKAKD